MKAMALPAAFLAAGLVAASLAPGCSSREPVRYFNKEKKFSIEFPGDWERREGFMGTAVMALRGAAGEEFRENVNVVAETTANSLPTASEYMSRNLAQMEKVLRDFTRIESGTTWIDKQEAKWVIYSHRMGSLRLKVLAYMILKDNRAYVITCTSTLDGFQDWRGEFELIAAGFTFG